MVGIHLVKQQCISNHSFKCFLGVVQIPAALPIIRHAGDKVNPGWFIDPLKQRHLGLPLTGVYIPRMRAGGLSIATATMQGQEQGPAGFWFLPFHE